MGRRSVPCRCVAAFCVAAALWCAGPLRAQSESRSAAAASRPFATVEWDSRPVVCDAAYPPWRWPAREAFEARSDVRRLRPLRVRVGRAELQRDRQPTSVLFADAVLEEEPQPGGLVVRCTAARPDPVPNAGADELLWQFWTTKPPPVADVAWKGLALTEGGDDASRSLRLVFAGADPPPDASFPARATAELFGYAAALLDDSPGDPPAAERECGHDDFPDAYAARLAHVALAVGATGKYLRQRLSFANFGFIRLNYAEYWPTSDDAQGYSLTAAPIDVARFLAGVTLQFDCDPPRACEVSTGTIAALAAEAGVAEEFERWLRSAAEDDALDARNRLRATQVLYALRARRCEGPRDYRPWFGPRRPIPSAVDAVRDVRLSAAAKLWLGLP